GSRPGKESWAGNGPGPGNGAAVGRRPARGSGSPGDEDAFAGLGVPGNGLWSRVWPGSVPGPDGVAPLKGAPTAAAAAWAAGTAVAGAALFPAGGLFPAGACFLAGVRQGRRLGMVAGSRASTATSVAAMNTTEGVRTIESETTVTENSAAHRYMISTLCRYE